MTSSPISTALHAYRHNPALAPLLTDAFLERMASFAQILGLWGVRANLTAKPNDPTEIAFHTADSLMPLVVLPDAFRAGTRILDFGSGAGFPGLILASACTARFTLVEARQKRASFLKVAAAELGLENVEVQAVRLEPAAVSSTFNAVLSRASGPSADFYAISGAALLPAGTAILYASPSQRLDLVSAQNHALAGYRRYTYKLLRGDVTVDRVLAVWHKTQKVP